MNGAAEDRSAINHTLPMTGDLEREVYTNMEAYGGICTHVADLIPDARIGRTRQREGSADTRPEQTAASRIDVSARQERVQAWLRTASSITSFTSDVPLFGPGFPS